MTTITVKGQVTLPKKVRDAVGLKPGDKVSIAAHPLMTGEPGGTFVSVTLANGQTLTDKPAPPPAAPKNP